MLNKDGYKKTRRFRVFPKLPNQMVCLFRVFPNSPKQMVWAFRKFRNLQNEWFEPFGSSRNLQSEWFGTFGSSEINKTNGLNLSGIPETAKKSVYVFGISSGASKTNTLNLSDNFRNLPKKRLSLSGIFLVWQRLCNTSSYYPEQILFMNLPGVAVNRIEISLRSMLSPASLSGASFLAIDGNLLV